MNTKQKIYFVDQCLDKMGGIERVINILANNLSDNNNVNVISMTKNYDKSYFEYKKNINFYSLLDHRKNYSIRYGKKRKIFYYVNRIYEKISDFLQSNKKIKEISKKFTKNDIIIFGRVEIALKFLPYINNAKKIIVREALHLYNHKKPHLLKKLFIEKVDCFIVSSDESINTYNDFFNKKVNIVKIYNPIGIVPKISQKKSKNVISVGRYDLQKGYDVLIKAWKNVNLEYPEWKLKIMGAGYYKNNMEKLINENNLCDSIELVPSSPDVVSELINSSIFVMASRIEGYANALVEAMACGLSCISFNWVMGVEDIIKDKENGIIVKLEDPIKYMNYNYSSQKDITSLSNAIIELIKDRDLMIKLGEEAKKITESREIEKIISLWKKNIIS